MKLAAILLAAGEGRRMGAPKALLDVRGRTLLDRHVARFREIGCDEIVVVLRPGLAIDSPVRIVRAATSSQAESLAVGVRALSVRDARVVITPVDMIPPLFRTYMELDTALEEGPELAVTPVHRGRGGHPVFVRQSALEPFVTNNPNLPRLRDVLAPIRRLVPVDDPSVLGDLDTPFDVIDYTLKSSAGAVPSF